MGSAMSRECLKGGVFLYALIYLRPRSFAAAEPKAI
jgi:hypothetical protein